MWNGEGDSSLMSAVGRYLGFNSDGTLIVGSVDFGGDMAIMEDQ